MRLLIEGPDNAGKTTLAHFVHENSRSFYHHPGGKPSNVEEEYKCLEDQQHLMMNSNFIIMDRCTGISQRVYNPSDEYDTVRKVYTDNLISLGAVVVYARPSFDRLMRVDELTWRDGEDEAHKQKIIRNQGTFIQRYDEIMAKIPCITYDFEDETISRIVRTKLVGAMNGSMPDLNWLKNIMHYRKV